MRPDASPLIRAYESCLGWLRRRPRRRQPAGVQIVQPVRVDLVGDDAAYTFGKPAPPPPEAAPLPPPGGTTGQPEVPSGAIVNPFRSALDKPASAPARAWSFNQTVLLSRRRRSSSLLVWTAIGTVGALGIWAVTAPLSETIAVQGKLEPGTSTKRIDAPVPGVVETVLVKEGQQVRKGDPLVRFDLRDPSSKLAAAESNRQRLVKENQIMGATLGDAAATAQLTPNQRLQLRSQAKELSTRQDAARQELAKAQVRLAGKQSNLATLNNIISRYASLEKQGAVSELQLLETRQRIQDTTSQIAEEEREIARLRSVLMNTGALTDSTLRQKMEENLRLTTDLDSQITLARQQIQYGLLNAPVDGVVFDIQVSPGSVVAQGTGTSAGTGSKPLLKIVPFDALQARVFIPNRAVGFVRPGLRADLSIDAFRASDFGYIPARVERVGSDALTPEEQSRQLGENASGLFYPAILRLDRQSVQLNRKQVQLQAGMSLPADIKLRERRFINILTGFLEDQRRNLERLR
jgi:HlyD family secretion protein